MKPETAESLLSLSKREKNPHKRMRLLAVSLFLHCHNRTQVASQLKVARSSVNLWVSSYLGQGLAGLEDKPRLGKKPSLSNEQKRRLARYIEFKAQSDEGGRLTGADIQQYISSEFNVEYHPNHIYKLLKSMGFCWITSRSRHPKQTQSLQDAFKKFPLETILHAPIHIQPHQIDIWFQDEARFGQQNTTTRLWAPKGSRPRALRQQQFEYVHLFGAVCPATGETEAIITPFVNKDIMHQHLELIAKRTKPGRHAVVVMDGAGWHTNDIAADIPNLSILKLPPYSPELNPIEQVWSWLRQHYLANRCFKGYEDIVDACSQAWNSFISCTKRVVKMCSREWAKVTEL
ncbi:IS630 family transposase [Shewanella baltica]|uniref:IS630 family transposase n=1 Tax=Shewanella baltica TaxID=62322 RepID=UPI00217E9E03|nr:IS630 family transposase [Shewanella baltica]MCS6130010.1 IS630 family transposase [Shewanella baltica]MCS6141640.1 IS630 family transposase [Shewanella baltica]MCS6147974.1 IS630 family transposase [Shewanella baltica]MCS6172503.1 IS630 family transposase [Shewanella baltica]MCS6189671.1 IS630 family transposase [Shewanella baltica]